MLDAVQLQEQFERMVIGASAVLAAVVREHCFDRLPMCFEERQHVVVEHSYLTYSDKLIEGSPMNSLTAVAVDQATRIPVEK